jgi:glucose-1-phosphate cytidylyltransferase
MKAVILAGGFGTRISEETVIKPKPMVEIGGRPILWHIMKIYSHYGIDDFIVCLGHKGYMIKEYFANYFLHTSDVTIHLSENRMDIHRKTAEPWRVTLLDTGELTQTGGRLRRVLPQLAGNNVFALTYGDGVADIDIAAEIDFHRSHGRLATVTAVRPQARFGAMTINNNRVLTFEEKPKTEGGWINGGFFLFSPRIANLLTDDATILEHEPLQKLAQNDQLRAYFHHGFWQPMDTLRDRQSLEEEWARGTAKWKVW